jgi:hypothetical protein
VTHDFWIVLQRTAVHDTTIPHAILPAGARPEDGPCPLTLCGQKWRVPPTLTWFWESPLRHTVEEVPDLLVGDIICDVCAATVKELLIQRSRSDIADRISLGQMALTNFDQYRG